NDQCQSAFSSMEKTLKGTSANLPLDKALSSLSSMLEGEKSRMPENPEKPVDARVTDALAAAKRELKDAEDNLQALRDILDRIRSQFKKGGSLKDEIQKASSDISNDASALRSSDRKSVV